ncbi:hypothetical protein AGR7A_Lc10054 [Agrobacterium deltaense NCPPB 1641]|uniref:Uncharacterized protein n=1 Tax=Agrobacterium deltaense NCPPB 1641 TaxID=1183425 RepID=A0A1S7TRX9_9HYPH|nr:hypothetical protein AGR7A_Lc10054 [Agrobacterium deltaense NCPPB 1641]
MNWWMLVECPAKQVQQMIKWFDETWCVGLKAPSLLTDKQGRNGLWGVSERKGFFSTWVRMLMSEVSGLLFP